MGLDAEWVFSNLYKGIDGYAISQKAREGKDYWYMGHTYGEVTYGGFLKMLALAKPRTGGVFYDLGSGVGKAVILSAMFGGFSKAIGIEIIPDLVSVSERVRERFDALSPIAWPKRKPEVSFVAGDFKTHDFSDADVLFMSATCFRYEMDLPMMRKLASLKVGTRIMTNSMRLELDSYSLMRESTALFSWGEAPVFIYEKA